MIRIRLCCAYNLQQKTNWEVDYRGCYRNKETKSGGGIWCVVLIHYVSLQTQGYSFICPELMPVHTDDSWVDVLSYAHLKHCSKQSVREIAVIQIDCTE